MSDWQPIEELELRDGIVALVCRTGTAENKVFCGHQTVHIATYEDLHWSESYGCGVLENPYFRITHFMPLPAPPNGEPVS